MPEPLRSNPSKDTEQATVRQEPGRRGLPLWVILLIGLVVIVLIASLVYGRFSGEESAGPNTGITISDLGDDPAVYEGAVVTVSGEISEVIDQDRFFIGEQVTTTNVLVTGVDSALEDGDPLDVGAVISVTGTVRVLDPAGFEEEVGEGGRSPAALGLTDPNRIPVIVAEEVELIR